MAIASPLSEQPVGQYLTPQVIRPAIISGAPDGVWDFASQDTQHSTHGLHTYVAAMIPALARRLIETYAPANGSVLDPFCGGGAVLVETIRSGREAIGRDINGLAVLVSKGKTTHISADRIQSAGAMVLARAKEYDGPPLCFPKSDFVEFWFKDYMLLPLTALRSAIEELKDASLRSLFQVLFSATVRSVSLTHRNEVRLRRMTPDEQATFNPDVLEVFSKYIALAKNRVPGLPTGAKADVKPENVRQLSWPSEGVDMILCSPPYGDERNGVNYTQFAKNMLYWLGYNRQEIRASKEHSLGWGKKERTVPPSRTLLDSLELISDNPTAVREAVAFYADYYKALHQLARVARSRIIIVIGNRVLHKQVLDNAQITAELMDAIGVQLEEFHFRGLPTKRLPKMREFGAAIDQEAILVFKK
jgi:site-specific DNA-methyltransferase (cytosine-N4-specific)